MPVSRDNLSVPCPLRAAARYAPDAVAIIGSQGTITYDELDGRVAAAAFRLRELEPGSRVVLYLPKDERYVTLMLAVIRAGHVACLVSDRLPPKGVAKLLERAACDALISDDDDLPRTADLYRVRPGTLLEDRHRAEPADIPLKRPA